MQLFKELLSRGNSIRDDATSPDTQNPYSWTCNLWRRNSSGGIGLRSNGVIEIRDHESSVGWHRHLFKLRTTSASVASTLASSSSDKATISTSYWAWSRVFFLFPNQQVSHQDSQQHVLFRGCAASAPRIGARGRFLGPFLEEGFSRGHLLSLLLSLSLVCTTPNSLRVSCAFRGATGGAEEEVREI